ncbi:YciI family protein [Euzebya pacifica]|nr:YciI family protein [Euzebya pacifica]
MLLIHSDMQRWDSLGEEGRRQLYADYDVLHAHVESTGYLVDASPLAAPDVATTVRVRGGEVLVTDGPFAETKEHLAGYYLLDCPDLDAALDVARRIPDARLGSVEVRPLRTFH